jgi:hypothetical protein
VHENDLFREVGQVQRLLDGGVAAADHGHALVAVEEAVAGRAGADALAEKGLLAGQAEVLRRGTGGDDQGIAAVVMAARQLQAAGGQVGLLDVVENDVDAEALNVGEHVLHQLRSLQVRGAAGPVLDFRRGGQLAALLHAGDEDRIEVGAGGVDGAV